MVYNMLSHVIYLSLIFIKTGIWTKGPMVLEFPKEIHITKTEKNRTFSYEVVKGIDTQKSQNWRE